MRKVLIIIIVFFINTLVGCASIKTTNNNSTGKGEMVKERMNKKFNQIEVKDISSNLVIRNSDEYKVYYQGNEKDKPDIRINDAKLQIKNRHAFSFSFHPQKTSTIIIELPNVELSKIDINSSNGNVTVTKLSAKKGSIVTANGDITIDSLKTSHGFELSSSNGNIEVSQNNASGYNFSVSNGEVKLSGRFKDNDLEVNTSSSNVLEIENSNGDIEVN